MISALLWSQRLLAWAIILQSIEFLQLRALIADDGVWRWRTLREESRGLGLFLAYPNVLFLIGARVLAAAALFGCLEGPLRAGALAFLFLSGLLLAFRWRGTFNGGSDYMTAIVSLALAFAALSGGSVVAARFALGYVAAQVCLSYFVAGWAKLARPEWRSGRALLEFLRIPGYACPPWIEAKLAPHPRAVRALAWSVMAFELSFPLALAGPRACGAYLAAALAFHLANAYVFGLNRFVWAWLAAYPALFYWSMVFNPAG